MPGVLLSRALVAVRRASLQLRLPAGVQRAGSNTAELHGADHPRRGGAPRPGGPGP